ncbi:MAG: DUF4234 domain-containing protein [Porticoccaceae bacterium]|nr:DUF4234 domain-containing protein [Pseudomonadales bacterium]MCP5173437.1 DUF4234 domain-containing protein [Pseudomonadales bacterium]MCP5303250.1 DUF4234 domain-containing protein [Pseudomonadales bacterium]
MTTPSDSTYSDVSNNPYATPDSDLSTLKPGAGISIFDRFSTWGVFGLSVITLGIYMVYWLFSRTKQLNSVVENKISDAFIVATVLCYIVNLFSGVLPYLGEGGAPNSFLTIGVSLVAIAGNILFVVWAFKVRNRINEITNSQKGVATWCGPVLTFFFSCFYLQYKINQSLDNLNSTNS